MEDAQNVIVFDLESATIYERPETEDEKNERVANAEKRAIVEAERKEQQIAKEITKTSAKAKLAALGLTEEEINALIK